ncbi:MAG: hypothetical protein JXM74_07520, partial [Fusobacteriaceae bacterium]|nr:hypothetical protein [Fusobacteriaceae bacterium]
MKFINYNSFDIEENKNNLNFEVDDLMASTISILNKKGYYTVSSCAGHASYEPVILEMPIKDFESFELEADYDKYEVISKTLDKVKIEANVLGK